MQIQFTFSAQLARKSTKSKPCQKIHRGIAALFFCRVGSNAYLPFYSFAAVAERTIPPPAPSPPYRRGGGVALHTSINCRSLMVRFFSPDGFPTGRDKLGLTPDISPLLAGGNITFATMLHLLHWHSVFICVFQKKAVPLPRNCIRITRNNLLICCFVCWSSRMADISSPSLRGTSFRFRFQVL